MTKATTAETALTRRISSQIGTVLASIEAQEVAGGTSVEDWTMSKFITAPMCTIECTARGARMWSGGGAGGRRDCWDISSNRLIAVPTKAASSQNRDPSFLLGFREAVGLFDPLGDDLSFKLPECTHLMEEQPACRGKSAHCHVEYLEINISL